ncbi:2TM domain-containing protein [Maribacter chungangensis]|uniref:2TM domain-containing protein n=1 Tax=Maribacter chungangensis TaxID=1069117 RepID=A0ABW3B4Y7_9FLAO
MKSSNRAKMENKNKIVVWRVLRVSLYITAGIFVWRVLSSFNEGIVWMDQLIGSAISFVYALIITATNIYFHQYITQRYSWEEETQKRLWSGAIGSILLTVFAYGIARMLEEVVFYSASVVQFINNEEISDYVFVLVIAILVSAILHAFYFYKALQDTKVKEQKIIAGTASAKFDALKNQLDPHFLFNSLNVLTSLIEEDPTQAQKFTTSLSKVYRYVLEQKNKDLVTVDEELQFARTYMKLLKMRFEDSIHLEIPDSCSNPEAKIVPLSLQLLLENAVKHNIVTAKKPLLIKVEEVNNMLVISNNLQEKQVVKKSTGVGLQNIRQRYHILTDREVRIEKTTSNFNVHLPMLSKSTAVIETQESYIEDKRYEKAKERVQAIKGFYGNLTSYLIVIPILIYINYRTTSFAWFLFPAIGWGFGLLGHGLQAYGYNPILGKSWEERKIKQYMDDENF